MWKKAEKKSGNVRKKEKKWKTEKRTVKQVGKGAKIFQKYSRKLKKEENSSKKAKI